MKKLKQLVMLAVVACALTLVAKVDSQAAGQVTGVKQTDAYSDAVYFSWNADLNADEYGVDISEDGKNWVSKGYTSSTQAYISSLSAGKSYYIRVTSYKDEAVSMATSAPLEVVTSPRTTVLNAVQTGATTNSVKIQYSGATGANYYRVKYGDNYIGASTSSTVTVSKLASASQYWVRAYACRRSASGFIAEGTYYYFAVKTLGNKINTKNFGITGIWANINVYDFGVSNLGSVDGYQFQFLTMKGKVKKTVTTTSSSIDVRNFIAGTFYKYRVRSYVTCGKTNAYSAWSDCKYIGMSKKFSGNASKKRIKCSWSKINSASKYVVYISTKQNAGYKKVKTLSAKKRTINITKYGKKKIKKGKTYYVKVVAKAKNGKKTVTSGAYWVGTVTVPRY